MDRPMDCSAQRLASRLARAIGVSRLLAVAALTVLGAAGTEAQPALTRCRALRRPAPAREMVHETPFYREGTFHALVGAVLIGGGFIAYRVLRSRLRWRAGPAGFVSEAVLAVDLTDSTRLATHYGEAVALRARNALEEQVPSPDRDDAHVSRDDRRRLPRDVPGRDARDRVGRRARPRVA